MDQQFARDVMHGLSTTPKYLQSKYFYDEKGDSLFRQIMELDEYYLTDCEFEIFQNHKQELLHQFTTDDNPFDLIELGAGDGKKTKVLMEYFLEQGARFTYKPIDISQNALNLLEQDLNQNMPDLSIETLQGEYFNVLSHIESVPGKRKVILFLGSNIGNFLKPVAEDFLTGLCNTLQVGDMLLLGVDLTKDPKVIAKAYNDSKGITREFNLNLLNRINRELKGDFNLENFEHFPLYNPISGTARSFLISKTNQTVTIDRLNASFHFEAWEPVHTEYSHKYRLTELSKLAQDSGFKIVKNYTDSREYFVDGLWQRF
jgi:dimethylhistidine N-methyltransferase